MAAPKRAEAHLGDIMGSEPPTNGSPALRDFEPLHRVVVTANGNLQRLISSYHNTRVEVRQVHSRQVAEGRFEREVVLVCFGVEFAVATSTVEISRADCLEAITTGGVAIGQLFRHLNILPVFELLGAGYEHGRQHFWRDYLLSGEGIHCKIHERIRSDVFALKPLLTESVPSRAGLATTSPAPTEPPSSAMPSFGDIMSPNTTGFSLPDGFTPLQRILLTANGNVERIVSSYYYEPLTVLVPLSHQRNSCVYDRQVTMLVRGEPFLHAKSTIFLTDPEWEQRVQEGIVPLGSLFRANHVLPTFHLRSVGRGRDASGHGFFWRVYTLASTGMTCEITETFAEDTFDKDLPAASLRSLETSDDYGLPI